MIKNGKDFKEKSLESMLNIVCIVWEKGFHHMIKNELVYNADEKFLNKKLNLQNFKNYIPIE